MKFAFFGTSEFAAIILKQLIEKKYPILEVYSQPSKPQGRGRIVASSPVVKCAQFFEIPTFCPNRLKDEAFKESFLKKNFDLIIVAAYGKILPEYILNFPKKGCINVHASLLPAWRGAAPIERSILAGEPSGVSIMLMDQGLDTGPVYAMNKTLLEHRSYFDLLVELANQGSSLLDDLIPQIVQDTVFPYPQLDEGISYADKIDKQELVYSLEDTDMQLLRKIFAFGERGFFGYLSNGERFKIISASHSGQISQDRPGTLFSKNKQLFLTTIDKDIQLLQVQMQGGKKLSASDFINGKYRLQLTTPPYLSLHHTAPQ